MTSSSDSNPGVPRRTGVHPGAVLRAMQQAQKTDVAPVIPRPAGDTAKPASITVIEDGNRVQRIVAHCECGRKIEIECDYDDPQSA